MVTPYVDLATIHVPVTGAVIPAAWGTQVRANFEAHEDPPACSVFNSAAVSVASATSTALAANSENFDNDAMHSTVTNTSRVTFQTAGRYQLLATVLFAADTDGVRNVKFRIDGTTVHEAIQVPAVSTLSGIVLPGIRMFTFTAGQFVECIALHNAGNALDVTLLEFAAVKSTR